VGTGYGEKLKAFKGGTDQVTEVLRLALASAMELSASDIHIEPEEHQVKVRLRIDGVLQDMVHLDKALQNPLISRIKILTKLKLNVQNLPQDGRLTFYWGSDAIDVRLSTLPSTYGEGSVLRLLGVGAARLQIDELGLVGRSRKVIEEVLQKPNGMVINTGPTGSGKTTTLYSFLLELNDPGLKVITIEDPVEYKLEGIQQTPIDSRVQFGFARALRAILRQDPDIVMVGEIRDGETAETALQAALTGHVVLTTLHTNDSFGAIPRLSSMGMKPFIIAPAINAIIAQRLVRRLCKTCKKETQLAPEIEAKVKTLLSTIPPEAEIELPSEQKFYNAPGCPECHNTGYKGRIGIYEVIAINDAMKALILREASMLEMKQQALKDGTLLMAQDGLVKALQGITDVEEVFRVAGD
jgi:type IV pilus assembly protein PilB